MCDGIVGHGLVASRRLHLFTAQKRVRKVAGSPSTDEDQAADVDGYGYPAHGVHSFQPIVNPDSNGTEQGALHGMISRYDPSTTSTIVQERSGNPRISTRPGLLILHRKVPRWPLNGS